MPNRKACLPDCLICNNTNIAVTTSQNCGVNKAEMGGGPG